MSDWHLYEEGRSIGRSGPEEGTILRDEEFGDEDPDEEEAEADARITLERDCPDAPFAITCSLYGWMAHTRRFSSEEAAEEAFEAMKPELSRLCALIPYEGDRDVEKKARDLNAAVEAFTSRFGG